KIPHLNALMTVSVPPVGGHARPKAGMGPPQALLRGGSGAPAEAEASGRAGPALCALEAAAAALRLRLAAALPGEPLLWEDFWTAASLLGAFRRFEPALTLLLAIEPFLARCGWIALDRPRSRDPLSQVLTHRVSSPAHPEAVRRASRLDQGRVEACSAT
ncbi:unnamed protein product, partial [Prorocentrum cordatum]